MNLNIYCEYLLVRSRNTTADSELVELTVHKIKRGTDGILFECSEATGKVSLGDTVYIKGVGLATVGDVVREEKNWALISFINIQKVLNEPHHSILRVIWVHSSIIA